MGFGHWGCCGRKEFAGADLKLALAGEVRGRVVVRASNLGFAIEDGVCGSRSGERLL